MQKESGKGKQKYKDMVAENPKFLNKSEKELFLLFDKDKKNLELRNELIQRNLYIAEILAKKYINRGIEYEDIYQVASLGLILAIERYDVNRGFEFSSFATPTIIGEIKKYFRDKGWSIRVPRKIQELSKKVNEAKVHLENTKGTVPEIKDIASYLGVSEEEIIEVMEASQVYRLKSLDVTYENGGEDKEVSLLDVLGEEDKSFREIENRDFFESMLAKLDDMERKIITERFFNQKTQMSIAKELDISQMTVSRMEKKILSKIKKEYEKSIN
ncbi:SigB/SigF/SigG family RNA polymerase sigma factor [Filifactor villosus]|uniref:SigB/SigF/SigG family RNA polymerase sigma factor n=1 Tax=Filifactor villosus TaxID=29374 RepID=A0ABV9QPN8_9FIRM